MIKIKLCLTSTQNGHQDENSVELHSENNSVNPLGGELRKWMQPQSFIGAGCQVSFKSRQLDFIIELSKRSKMV